MMSRAEQADRVNLFQERAGLEDRAPAMVRSYTDFLQSFGDFQKVEREFKSAYPPTPAAPAVRFRT